ncbi:MAG TPA: RNA polymerase sigma-70 factor [Chitinophagaceae bacterium]|nr:RNA polymerase sigma-70 factor [Chitinophagaceae bacterium]
MVQEEIKIITRFKQRDAKAFAYIFKLHRKALVYFAEKIVGIREEAEDIVADSFMKLWAKHNDFDHLSQIKSFLYVVTRNSCLNFLKYSKRVSASQKEFSYWANDKEEEILHIMYRAELLTELNSEIEILPQKMREVFELSFFQELPSGEIANKLGLSVKTVRNQRAKAVHLIKAAFLKRNLAIAFLIFLMYCRSSFIPA